MTHWTEQYISRQYDPDHYNCGHLMADIQREVFGRDAGFIVPKETEALDKLLETINTQRSKVVKVEQPEEGDLALLCVRGEPTHIGVVWYHNNRPYILHGMNRKRSVINTELAVLERFGMTVEGWYRPIEKEKQNDNPNYPLSASSL